MGILRKGLLFAFCCGCWFGFCLFKRNKRVISLHHYQSPTGSKGTDEALSWGMKERGGGDTLTRQRVLGPLCLRAVGQGRLAGSQLSMRTAEHRALTTAAAGRRTPGSQPGTKRQQSFQ